MPIKKLKSKKRVVSLLTNLQKKSRRVSPMVHVIFFTVIILGLLVFLVLNQNLREGRVNFRRVNYQPLVDKPVKYNVFADHFVNDLSINMNETNFHYDKATTAFTYQPLFNWEEITDMTGMLAYKKLGEQFKYENGQLLFGDKKISIPGDLRDVKIINVRSYKMGETYLVGFVFKQGEKEKGRAYKFDGQNFSSLDPKNVNTFESRDGFPGAVFAFGGTEDNFIVLYSGYDLLGYQVVDGRFYDLRQFFSLRLSDGGFEPELIKNELGGDTVWYICSKTEGEPRFIKLWQNESDSVKGSISFTETLFGEKGATQAAYCSRTGESSEVMVQVENTGSQANFKFIDRGFSQGNYTLVTNNLFKEYDEEDGQILKATFNDLIACDDKFCGEEVLGNGLKFAISGDGTNFDNAKLGKEINFASSGHGLYWKITSKNENKSDNYSPWIDGLLSISYSWK